MCIEIKYEKFVSESGEPMVRINKIKALPLSRLPAEYLNGVPLAYFETRGTGMLNNRVTKDCLQIEWTELPNNEYSRTIDVGQELDITDFNKLMKIAKKAGKRLMKINKKNKKKAKKGWQGQEALKI